MSAKLNLIDCRALFEPKFPQVLSSLVALSVNAMQLTGRTVCAEEMILFTDAKDLSRFDSFASHTWRNTDRDTLFSRTIYDIGMKFAAHAYALQQNVEPREPQYHSELWRKWMDSTSDFFNAYDKLDAGLQSTLGATFAELMSQAMRDPEFSRLCADPDIAVSGLPLEQRMKTALDPQALYAFAQSCVTPA